LDPSLNFRYRSILTAFKFIKNLEPNLNPPVLCRMPCVQRRNSCTTLVLPGSLRRKWMLRTQEEVLQRLEELWMHRMLPLVAACRSR
jgi:hypothetical protein